MALRVICPETEQKIAGNLNITIAMDSFKGSMTSLQAGHAAAAGVHAVKPEANVTILPVADGGEGTLEALSYGKCVQKIRKTVSGPLGQPVEASYAVIKEPSSVNRGVRSFDYLHMTGTAICESDWNCLRRSDADQREDTFPVNKGRGRSQEDCALIEMAETAGLTLVPTDLRNPLYTTTYGVGELIADALDQGIRKFIIGLGGSATNDAGIGMLTALGWRFLKREDICEADCSVSKDRMFLNEALRKRIPIGADLAEISGIDESKVRSELAECSFTVACDVANPLYGPEGASCVYAPQKGATPEQVQAMDEWMRRFAGIVESQKGKRFAEAPGAGAAGGMGFAMLAFLHARMMSGIEIVLEQTGAEEAIKNSDLVLTGEGCLDGQTLQGKTVAGVARLAEKYGKPVYAFAGVVKPDSRQLVDSGLVKRCIGITPEGQDLQEAMRTETACENLKQAVQMTMEEQHIL